MRLFLFILLLSSILTRNLDAFSPWQSLPRTSPHTTFMKKEQKHTRHTMFKPEQLTIFWFGKQDALLLPAAPAMHHHPIIPWKDPTISLSSAPLMGRQMGVVETPGIEPLGYEMDGDVKVFTLIAQPIEQTIVDERHSFLAPLIPKQNNIAPAMHHPPRIQTIKGWGYNGSTPGPTIEATEGDRVRIIVKNELPEPTSVHWHGIELPNDQDGAAPETQRPIMPGETYTYEFTLYQSGTVMYHSEFNPMKQDHMGLHGTFVIHPKTYEQRPDRQFVIMLAQWALLPGSPYLDLVSMNFNWFTFNGHAAPNIPVLTIRQGERVRLRFANVIMDSHPIHVHGYIWQEVGTEGGPIALSARVNGSTIMVHAGTTRDVEFVAWNPGIWRLHCHKLHHIVNSHADVPMGIMEHGGMFTLLHVIPNDPQTPWQHPSESEGTP